MKKLFTSIVSILFILNVILIQSCKKDEPTNPNDNTNGTIGINGGKIELSDGAKLEIPQGALNSDQTITFTKLETQNINTDCGIYELGPDGLQFQDSVLLTLPYDYDKIPIEAKSDQKQISVMVLENDKWKKLNAVIDTVGRVATIKTTHFSTYIISFPGYWGTYYYFHKSDPEKLYQLPYYAQWEAYWCFYYSTSMALRYKGYFYKAHQLAAFMNSNTSEGPGNLELFTLDGKLNQKGIQTELAFPPWYSTDNLSGYLIAKLDEGNPIIVGSGSIDHAFVVSGHNPTGFYVSDPSGAFLEAAFGTLPSQTEREMVLVSYDQFKDALFNFWDILLWGAESTIVITSTTSQSGNGPTINFPGTQTQLLLENKDQLEVTGSLELNGTYQPFGYAFTKNGQIVSEFAEDNFIWIEPEIANSNQTQSINVKVYYKVDNQNVPLSPISLTIDKGNSSFHFNQSKFQIGDLTAGTHKLQIELRSENSSVVYDSLSFLFKTTDVTWTGTPCPGTPTVTYEGKTYNTVQIGTQCWLRENLDVGTRIDGVAEQTDNGVIEKNCYDNNPANCETYGGLYQWDEAMQYVTSEGAQGICPPGWHIPTSAEFQTLSTEVGGDGNALKEIGQGRGDGAGTNTSGFSALLAGGRNGNGSFFDLGGITFFWSSTEVIATIDGSLTLYQDDSGIYLYDYFKGGGFSVRCVKD